MATPIVMPKLGLTMTAGAVSLWVAGEGQAVAVGDIVVEITTEKITYQVEASVDGVLLKIVVEEGEDIPIGTLIGVIGEAGEDVTGMLASSSGLATADEEPHPPPSAATAAGEVAGGADAGDGAAAPGTRVLASPAARRLATELGVDLAGVTGSGPGRRIITEDVTAAAEHGAPAAGPAAPARADAAPAATRATPAAPTPAAPTPEAGDPSQRTVRRTIPYVGMRRTIGEHMAASRNASATVTHHVRADVHELVEALSKHNEGHSGEGSISITAALVKAVAASIEIEPAVNATLVGGTISVWADINIGVAVAVPDGLIVPVIKHADRKGAAEIARELRDLAGRGREGTLLPDDVTGGTFTISSLAGYGSVDWFTPIINQPEAAILGVGRVVDEVVAVNRSIVVRHTVGLSLTFDHRIVDGAPAAGFLKVLLAQMEDPAPLLA